jgi:hypothetical protein
MRCHVLGCKPEASLAPVRLNPLLHSRRRTQRLAHLAAAAGCQPQRSGSRHQLRVKPAQQRSSACSRVLDASQANACVARRAAPLRACIMSAAPRPRISAQARCPQQLALAAVRSAEGPACARLASGTACCHACTRHASPVQVRHTAVSHGPAAVRMTQAHTRALAGCTWRQEAGGVGSVAVQQQRACDKTSDGQARVEHKTGDNMTRRRVHATSRACVACRGKQERQKCQRSRGRVWALLRVCLTARPPARPPASLQRVWSWVSPPGHEGT